MQPINLELPIRDTANQQEKIVAMSIRLPKRLGFQNAADMLTKSYLSYDETMPAEAMDLFYTKKLCEVFTDIFRIEYKEDISYAVRHPELHSDAKADPISEAKRRIIVFDLENNDPDQLAARSFFEGIKPKDRAELFGKMLKQYFTFNNCNYFFEQAAYSLYEYMCSMANFDEDGNAQKEISHLVDIIWQLGKKQK